MIKLNRYLKLWWIIFKTNLTQGLSFRLNFFMGILGSFCYILLYVTVIFFLTKVVSIGNWSQKEMFVLLGCQLIVVYTYFFLFWRGLRLLIQNIRTGQLDHYLIKPIDTQFFVSLIGGGIHNFISMIFGLLILIYGTVFFLEDLNILKLSLLFPLLLISVLDYYSLVFLAITINFKYGYVEEIMDITVSFQDFMRYPTEAFYKLPLFFVLIAVPFSALTTIPAMLIINKTFPTIEIIIFLLLSMAFILATRYLFYRSIKNYSSGN